MMKDDAQSVVRLDLGRVTFQVLGDRQIAKAVVSDLRLPASPTTRRPQAIFDFPSEVIPGSSASRGEMVEGHLLRFQIYSDDGTTAVRVTPAPSIMHKLLPGPVFRLGYPGYIDQAEHLARAFFYQAFNGIMQAGNAYTGQTFIHAAAIEKGDERVLIIGRGGMGKTGSLLRLVLEHGWRYISDDWTVIDDLGRLELSHKPLQIFPRNLIHLRGGEKLLLEGRTASDRFMWSARRKLGKNKGLSRKSDALGLFGQSCLGSPGEFTGAILVERGDVGVITESSVSTEKIAHASSAIVRKELQPSLKVLTPWLRCEFDNQVDVSQIYVKAEAVMNRALSGKIARLVTAPMAMLESQIEDYLVGMLADGGSGEER